MSIPFNPDWRVAPGETLREIFEERPVTHGRAVETLGPGVVQAILDGTYHIDEFTALGLEGATDVSKQFWLNLEAAYRKPLPPDERRDALLAHDWGTDWDALPKP